MVLCCVLGCNNRSDRGKKVSFYRVPSVNDRTDEVLRHLTTERRELWLRRINRGVLHASARICSDHFISGKPALLDDTLSEDWGPSVNIGPVTNNQTLQCDEDVQPHPKKRKLSDTDWTTTTSKPTGQSVSCQTDCKLLMSDAAVQCDIPVITCTAGQDSKVGNPLSSPVSIRSVPPSMSTSSQLTSSQGSDFTYKPSQSASEDSERDKEQSSATTDNIKFIVYKESLMELFLYCPVCSHHCSVNWHVIGTFVSVSQQCSSCDFSRRWHSQPMIGQLPAGNIHLSASILFTGGSFSKVDKVLAAMKVESISSATFYDHARRFLQPTILTLWRDSQSELLQQLAQRSGDLIIGGDMRADSPGHCAKYGAYSVLELRSNRIIDVQLVQSNEVGGSSHMEKEGLVRSMNFLHTRNIAVDTLITDRHPQIQKYVREKMPSVTHYYDVWHTAKGLSKKLEALGKERDCAAVRDWSKSIVNHLYWSAASSTTGDEAVAKWQSVANHVQNVHEHDNWQFPACQHGDLNKKWLRPSTKACEKLVDIVQRKQLLTDVRKLSPHCQTSAIEAYHSLILQFAPKNVVFTFKGMLCRLLIAALHYNENADRTQLTNTSGKPVYRVRFPKFKKGGCTIVPAKKAPTYGYVDELLHLLFSHVVSNAEYYQQLHSDVVIPPTLCSSFDRPTAAEMSAVTSRFRAKQLED